MTRNDGHQGLVPAEEAARELETTVLNLLMHIKRGLLVGREIDGVWHVTSESLTAYRQEGKGEKARVVCRSGCGANKGGCGSCG